MLSQFTVQTSPTTFEKIWAPIETILQSGADLLQRVGPYFIETKYPITPKGTYQPPIVTPVSTSPASTLPALNMNWPMLAVGAVVLFVMFAGPKKRTVSDSDSPRRATPKRRKRRRR